MTPLEESIELFSNLIRVANEPHREQIKEALRAFAAAIREEGREPTCGGEKPPEPVSEAVKEAIRLEKSIREACQRMIDGIPEPKECTKKCHGGCDPCCSCGKPTDLPAEVRDEIDKFSLALNEATGFPYRYDLERFAKLCLRVRDR